MRQIYRVAIGDFTLSRFAVTCAIAFAYGIIIDRLLPEVPVIKVGVIVGLFGPFIQCFVNRIMPKPNESAP